MPELSRFGGMVIYMLFYKVFMNPTVFHGVITWNNGETDIAPEYVYEESYLYEDSMVYA